MQPDRPEDLVEAPEERPTTITDGPDDIGGRVAAIGHLSSIYVRLQCVEQALADHGVSPTDGEAYGSLLVSAAVEALADLIAAPLEISNVLEAIEETIAQSITSHRTSRTITVATNGREAIARAMVDARQQATEDETPDAEPNYDAEPAEHRRAREHDAMVREHLTGTTEDETHA